MNPVDNLAQTIIDNYNYWVSISLMMIGFYIVIKSGNLVKKLMGLAIFQTSVLLLYISASKVTGASYPILADGKDFYVNPLPHVLMLTAIVVGVATIAVGLAIVVRIKESYGTIEEDEILASDLKFIARAIKYIKQVEAGEETKNKDIKHVKVAVKKPAMKKVAAKKTVVKKPAVKKVAAKKSAKTTAKKVTKKPAKKGGK